MINLVEVLVCREINNIMGGWSWRLWTQKPEIHRNSSWDRAGGWCTRMFPVDDGCRRFVGTSTRRLPKNMGMGFELRPTIKLRCQFQRLQHEAATDFGWWERTLSGLQDVKNGHSGCCHWALPWCYGPINETPMKEGPHLTPIKLSASPPLKMQSPGKFWLLGIVTSISMCSKCIN